MTCFVGMWRRLAQVWRWLGVLAAGAVLQACGGGSSDDPGVGGATTSVPAVITLSDVSEQVLASNVLSPGSVYLVKARLVPATTGVSVANQLVTFRTDASYAGFFPAPTFVSSSPTTTVTTTVTAVLSAITDATGVARAYLLGKQQNGSIISATCAPITCVATPLAFQTYPLNAPPDSVLSGQPSVTGFTLGTTTPVIEGLLTDGATSVLSARVSDRFGNPVQAGTRVYWKAAYGTIDPYCDLDSTSSCEVTYATSGQRPANGLVRVLAYVEGAEEFTDLNGNRRYDAGEPFIDVGSVYLDRNLNGIYDPISDELIAGSTSGNSSCNGSALTLPNTCDGAWSSKVRLPRSLTLTLSGSRARIQLESTRANGGFRVSVKDQNGNPMPTGTTVTMVALDVVLPDKVLACKVTSVQQVDDLTYDVVTNNANGCALTPVQVTVKTPAGTISVGTL